MRTLGFAALLTLTLTADALANRSNPIAYRYSGRPGDGTTRDCTDCHDTPAVSPPAIDVDGLDGLRAGGSATLTLTVTSSNANPSERLAGFVVATDGAGVFSNTAGDGITNHCAIGNVVKHEAPASSSIRCDGTVPCPSFFDAGGAVAYSLVLERLQPGSFTLYVGVNDSNNNGFSSGDRGAAVALPFTVADDDATDAGPEASSCVGPSEGEGEGEGEGELPGEGEGETPGEGETETPTPGCLSVSGRTDVLGLALVALSGLLLRRRRKGRGTVQRWAD